MTTTKTPSEFVTLTLGDKPKPNIGAMQAGGAFFKDVSSAFKTSGLKRESMGAASPWAKSRLALAASSSK